MKDQVKFTIITPAYQAETTISTMVESVLRQSYDNFEMLIVDDGSTDNTYDVIRNFQARDSRVRAFTIPNSGPGGARNYGLTQAQGEYILFLDADDLVGPDFLAKYVRVLAEKPKLDWIVTGYTTDVYDDHQLVSRRETTYPTKHLTDHQSFLKELYPLMAGQMMYVVWNKVYRRALIDRYHIRFPEGYRSCEDRIFNIRYANHVHQCQVLEDLHFTYRFDGKNSLTNKYFANKFETFLEFYRELLALVNADYRGYASLFLKGVMSCLIALHTPSCPLTKQEKKAYIDRVIHHPVVYKSATIASTDSMMKKVIVRLFLSQSIPLNYQASKMMLAISNQSPKWIEKFKGAY